MYGNKYFWPLPRQVAARDGTAPNLQATLRVAPLFEMLEDLHAGASVVKALLANPWYREHLKTAHGNHQEIMLGYVWRRVAAGCRLGGALRN